MDGWQYFPSRGPRRGLALWSVLAGKVDERVGDEDEAFKGAPFSNPCLFLPEATTYYRQVTVLGGLRGGWPGPCPPISQREEVKDKDESVLEMWRFLF